MMNQKNMKKEKENRSEKIVKKEKTQFSQTDPLGSYTGCPKDPTEVPTQDADDL